MMKICGQKNELSDAERARYHEKLGKKYQIGCQIGVSGAQSSAYLLLDDMGAENQYVLKIPSNPDNASWAENQKAALDMCAAALKDYDGRVYVPKAELMGDDFLVEPYAGEELTSAVYSDFLASEKQNIANEVADLLFYLHQNSGIGEIMPLHMLGSPPIDEVYAYLEQAFDLQQREYMTRLISDFKNRDIADEKSAMTHADIRSQNILYDRKQKKVAVIDFELLKRRNIYHDFVPFAAASFKLPYELLKNMIGSYNRLSEKHGIAVDPGKVALLHRIGVFHEYGRVALYHQKQGEDLPKVCGRIFQAIARIDCIFTPDSLQERNYFKNE